MAKELPYFKYFPSEWVTGDITICDMESQGLFINLCCYYWQRNCSMSLANAKQRFSKHEAALKQLIDFDIIKIDEGENIIINFLDEQMNEFVNVSEKRAIAGKKGGEAKAKQKPSKKKAKPSNKEIDKDKEVDKDIYKDFDFFKDKFKEIWLNEFIPIKKSKKASVTDRALESGLNKIKKLSGGDYDIALEILEKSVNGGWTDFYKKDNKINNSTHIPHDTDFK